MCLAAGMPRARAPLGPKPLLPMWVESHTATKLHIATKSGNGRAAVKVIHAPAGLFSPDSEQQGGRVGLGMASLRLVNHSGCFHDGGHVLYFIGNGCSNNSSPIYRWHHGIGRSWNATSELTMAVTDGRRWEAQIEVKSEGLDGSSYRSRNGELCFKRALVRTRTVMEKEKDEPRAQSQALS